MQFMDIIRVCNEQIVLLQYKFFRAEADLRLSVQDPAQLKVPVHMRSSVQQFHQKKVILSIVMRD